MAAVAEVMSTVASQPDPRGCDLPTCPVCADSMVAAEASAYLNDHVITLSLDLRYLRLWLRHQTFGEEVRLQLIALFG